jgi:D-arginine dehydrogenase
LFWLAGQGGYGIQTAPAVARAAATLLQGKSIPADIVDLGVDAAALSPGRSGLGSGAGESRVST